MADKNAQPEIPYTEVMEKNLKMIADRIGKMIHMQKVAMMGPEKVYEFPHEDRLFRMYLPFADDDFVQKNVILRGTFYEDHFLKQLKELDLFDSKGVAFDVGANIGNHTIYFSEILGASKVVAFEPQNIAHDILKKNVELNGLEKKVKIVKKLVGSQKGEGVLAAHFGTKNLGGTAFEESKGGDVEMTSLDAYCKEAKISKIDLLKIDVEGMQLPVLAGAEKILSDMKPAVWMELRVKNGEYDEPAAILAKYGYKSKKLGPNDFLFMIQ